MNESHRPSPRQGAAAVRSIRARYARSYRLRVAALFAGVARDGLLAAFKAVSKASRRSDPGGADS
ncbi:hypothetical protein ACFVVX_33330 [Kitasatospora sp. NPDC058170]|uniref:hypothetical protein n=1 Tax=Kitasatospora sp. NPDC058170 TaxID=3346364 RepID=UPI0036DDE687